MTSGNLPYPLSWDICFSCDVPSSKVTLRLQQTFLNLPEYSLFDDLAGTIYISDEIYSVGRYILDMVKLKRRNESRNSLVDSVKLPPQSIEIEVEH